MGSIRSASARRHPRVRNVLRWVAGAWIACGLALVLLFGLEWTAERLLLNQRLRHADFWKPGFPDQPDDWLEAFAVEMDGPVLDLESRPGGLQWVPYAYYRGGPVAGAHVNVGEDGLRAGWNPTVDPAARRPLRVFFFGGSTVWGVGARDDWTIPSWLSRLASDEELLLDVVNFGQLAYVNTQELITLLGELRRGNVPDAVVFLDGLNDIHAATLWGAAGASVLELHRALEFESLKSTASVLLTRAATNLSSVRLVRRWQHSRSGPALLRAHEASPDVLRREIVAAYAANVRAARALAVDFRFEVLHYWQPLLFFKQPKTASERTAQNKFSLPLVEFYRSVYEERGRLAGSPEGELGAAAAQCHDLGELLSGARWSAATAFFDECHLTERANAAVARRILEDLRPLLQARRTAAALVP